MKNFNKGIRNSLLCLAIMVVTFGISVLLQDVMHTSDQITTIYIFAVFLISIITDGYVYGISCAIISTIAVNYAFTFPFFAFNYTIPENIMSSLIMVSISILTSTLTTKIKQQETIKQKAKKNECVQIFFVLSLTTFAHH